MSFSRIIVCLANSKKLGGRCVAGRIYNVGNFGEWIRPVSSRDTEEISLREEKYDSGGFPDLLDLIDITFIEHRPHGCQQENYLIDASLKWKKVGSIERDELENTLDKPEQLWINGHCSYNGFNDQVPENQANELDNSLVLIKPSNLRLCVGIEGIPGSIKKVRTKFRYNNSEYWLILTDPQIKSTFLRKGDGEYSVSNALICVSLGEPFEGYCYKLVASIITSSPLR